MPRGVPGSGKKKRGGVEQEGFEPIDFQLVPRYQLGEEIERLRLQVAGCRDTVNGAPDMPLAELSELSKEIVGLKADLLAKLAVAKVKKKRAPWGSKKKGKTTPEA